LPHPGPQFVLVLVILLVLDDELQMAKTMFQTSKRTIKITSTITPFGLRLNVKWA